ncbi:hypothetical protein [Actinotalea sp. C106]|uniref:hypothetical protein n=1 Tax=Actinotalea sp. C106 TaxID=2908644 RepID=UPI002027B2F9|nr:hypothetical protein [Actinotalea sp. C106]
MISNRALALQHLKPHLPGYDPADPDTVPDHVINTAWEAGRVLVRAALGMGGMGVTVENTQSSPQPLTLGAGVRGSENAVERLAGSAAAGELVEALLDDAHEYRWVMTASGEPVDWASLAPGADPNAAEAVAIALVRDWFDALLTLTRALLDAPGHQLSWDAMVDLLGEDVNGSGYPDPSTFDQAWADLASGRIDPVTPGWPTP